MERAPLWEVVQTDTMALSKTKLTPDKTKDMAAAAVAAKLLDSAKKSQTKKLAKRMKLSLKKAGGDQKSTATSLAVSGESDLNETVEFKDSVSMKSVLRSRLGTRKRKKALANEDARRTKSVRSETSGTEVCDEDTDEPESGTSPLTGVRLTSSCGMKERSESECEKDLSTSQHTCPACGKMWRRGQFVRHMQVCLQQQRGVEDETNPAEADIESCSTDAEGARKRETESSDENEALPKDYIFCQLCQKELTHMNSQRRTLHINKCMDEEEKKKEEAEERRRALEAAKTKVLDCPMCGKPLATAVSRQRHLKKCASTLSVGPDQLVAAVKQQEEEHQATLAAGILPASNRRGRNTRQNSASTRRGLATMPRSKLDEDTQLAMAISSSLQADAAEAGPSTSGTTAAPSKRGRKNKQEVDHLLLTLTETQAASRIESRVSELIMEQEEEDDEENIPPLPPVSRDAFQGKRTEMVQWSADETARQSKMFWRLSSLDEQQSRTAELDSDAPLEFYVPALMPPVEVSSVTAGSKIRRMSEIPGRCGSQKPAPEGDVEETSQEDDMEVEHVPPPSTQTALLLADMAAEADESERMQQSPLSQPVLSAMEREIQEDLVSAFSSLVNQQEFSDVIIHAAGETTLYAHGAILSVRCPALLRMCEEGSGIVDLSDWPPQAVTAVLNFVYAGVTTVDQHWILDTGQLAHRLGLTAFAEILRNQQLVQVSQDITTDPAQDVTTDPAYVTTDPAQDDEDQAMNCADGISIHTGSDSSSADSVEEEKKDMEAVQGHITDICGHREQVNTKTTSDSLLQQSPLKQNVDLDHVKTSPRDRKSVCGSVQLNITQNSKPCTDFANLATKVQKSSLQSGSTLPPLDECVRTDQVIIRDKENEMPEGRVKAGTLQQDDDLNDSKRKGNSSVAHSETELFTAEFEKELSQKIRYVCAMVDSDSKAAKLATANTSFCDKKVTDGLLSTDKTQNKNTENTSSFDNDDEIRILDVLQETDDQMSDGVNRSKLSADDGDRNMENLPQAKEVVKTLQKQDVEPVDSIEISDEDLFSGDEIDVSCLPSTPHFSGRQVSAAVHGSGQKSHSREMTESPDDLPDLSVTQKSLSSQRTLVQESEQLKDEPGENVAGDVHNNSSKNQPSPSVKSSVTEQGRLCPPLLEPNFTSFSVSDVESSHRIPSLRSPQTGFFKASTPQQGADSKGAGKPRRKSRLSGNRNLFESCEVLADVSDAQVTPVQNRHSTGIGSTGADMTGPAVSSGVNVSGKSVTPCASVVEQDSLYITPAVEQSKVRRTFQLVTPMPHLHRADSHPVTPVSHYNAEESLQAQTSSSGGSSSIGKGGCSGRVDCDTGANEVPVQSEVSALQRSEGKEGGSLHGGENDTDSDLEIIDTSLIKAPSPKFSISSRISSSQPEANSQPANRTVHPSQTENHQDSSHLATDHFTTGSPCQSKSPMLLDSQSLSVEYRPSQGKAGSPCGGQSLDNPGSPAGHFSQRSADSDKELLRAAELLAKHTIITMEAAGLNKADSSPEEDVEQLCDTDMAGHTSPMEEDVWEGFADVDVYNPDLHLMGDDPGFNPPSYGESTVPVNSVNPAEPACEFSSMSANTASDHIPGRRSTSSESSVKLPRKQTSMKSSRCSQSHSFSPGQNTSSKKRSDHQSIPVSFRSSSLAEADTEHIIRFEVGGRENARSQSHPEGRRSPAGFFIDEEDTEAANSSFLWSEENAPMEQSGAEEAALVHGREESVQTEKLLSATPNVPQQRKKGGKSTWVPSSPFTPMPGYDNMNTPSLKREVQKYGLKPVGKKRMKLVLKEIYDKTHQYETDSDCEVDAKELPNLGPPVLSKETDALEQRPPKLHKYSDRPKPKQPAKQPSVPPLLHKQSARGKAKTAGGVKRPPVLHKQPDYKELDPDQPPVLQKEADPKGQAKGKKATKTKRGLARKPEGPVGTESSKKGQTTSNQMAPPKSRKELETLPSHQSPTKRSVGGKEKQRRVHTVSPAKSTSVSPAKSTSDYSSSPEKGSFSSSQDSDTSGRPDVSVFEELGAESDEDITPSQQASGQDLPQRLMHFFQSDPELYCKVLTYEPLDLGVVKEDLKAAGIRCSQEKLLNFLDEKCITFTTKNMIPRKRRNRGKKPRTKKLQASQK